MNDYLKLFAQVIKKESADDITVEEIKGIINEYPYFSPARLALIKLSDNDSEEYKTYVQQATLVYTNPIELNYILHQNGSEDFSPSLNKEIELAKSILASDNQITEQNKEVVSEQSVNIPSPSETLQKEVEASNQQINDLAFEPFHTVDYFASQGIKLSQQEATDDRMSKQLKSFTEWIRSMKKLPSTEIAKNVNKDTEKKVENLAEASVEETNVITEAMAEVWEKQRNYQKAIEVYNKLSLIYPAKRPYFAAKIKHLEENIS